MGGREFPGFWNVSLDFERESLGGVVNTVGIRFDGSWVVASTWEGAELKLWLSVVLSSSSSILRLSIQ